MKSAKNADLEFFSPPDEEKQENDGDPEEGEPEIAQRPNEYQYGGVVEESA